MWVAVLVAVGECGGGVVGCDEGGGWWVRAAALVGCSARNL